MTLRFFAGDIQDKLLAGHLYRHLQGKGGFANAGVTADQYNRTGDHSPAQDTCEFPNGQQHTFFYISADLM